MAAQKDKTVTVEQVKSAARRPEREDLGHRLHPAGIHAPSVGDRGPGDEAAGGMAD